MVPYDNFTVLVIEGIIYFVLLALGLRTILNLALRVGMRITSRTANTLDDAVVEAVKSVLTPLVLFFSFALTSINFFPTALIMDYPLSELLVYIGIMLGAWTCNRVIGRIVEWYDLDLQAVHKGKRKELFSFVRKMIGVLIYSIALIIMLDRAGIQIAPLIAGLGVAGLAVALALQGTLSNLFAGIHILAAQPIRTGQFIIADNDPA